jgi:4-alpha-glucanotransferase
MSAVHSGALPGVDDGDAGDTLRQRILTLAQAAGLQADWIDAFGHPQTVACSALSRILNAMELPHGSAEAYDSSLRRLGNQSALPSLPPLITAEVERPVALPALAWLYGQPYSVTLDDGSRIEGVVSDDVSQPPTAAPIARYGYHSLTIGDRGSTLAVAPVRCFGVQDAVHAAHPESGSHARWGLALQLYGLRRPGDGGIGDFSALATLVRAAAARGASAVTISPVHAMFAADLLRYSPYGPSSRLFLNALHVDPAAVLGPAMLEQVLREAGPEAQASHAALEREELIDWPRAAALRLDLLRRLFAHFKHSGDAAQRAALEAFRQQGGSALEYHARYEALNAWLRESDPAVHSDWYSWPPAYRQANTPEVEAFAAAHSGEIEFHVFLQWQAARGLAAAQQAARDAGMAIGLISDLAVGAESGGSQAWSHQGEIIKGLSIGAPPDLLNTRGQSWGLGAFSPFVMRERGFRGYIDMLRACFAYAGGVRIDHVLGLARVWLVPAGASAAEGAYLRYPIQDLLRLIALESWRYRAIVIGEDLGTVPAGFDSQLAQAGLLGIRVLWFETFYGGFKAPGQWSRDAIAVSTTHDLPTIAGWWRGEDIDWQVRLALLPDGIDETRQRALRAQQRAELWQALRDAGCTDGEQAMPGPDRAPIEAVIRFLAQTPAPLMILPLEDALGLRDAPNLPGTVDSHPNWRRRMHVPVAQLLDEPACAQRLALLGRLRS